MGEKVGAPVFTATISSKGQVVIPAELRRRMDLHPGDVVVFDLSADDHEVIVRRRESWDELSARFSSWISPGTPPLEDAHKFYESREPRT